MAKKAKRMRAYRLPDETIFEIERLAEEWQCTQSDVVQWAVQSLRSIETLRDGLGSAPLILSADHPKELKVEYDVE